MYLCVFYSNNEQRVGVRTERGVADISPFAPDIISAINLGVTSLKTFVDNYNGVYHDEKSLRYGNVSKPNKIVCAGLNYRDHAEETGGSAPEQPVFFSKFNDTLVPADSTVSLPSWMRCYDYEAELVVIIGKYAYNIPEEEAENCIFGYSCGNDLSARDSQFLSSQWLIGKNFPGSAPAGPWILTADSFNPGENHTVCCYVNGELRQNGNTADMLFSCRDLVSSASKYFTLEPGDLIFTGTPAGVMLGRPKGERKWLVPGDIVTVEIDKIGSLTTVLN